MICWVIIGCIKKEDKGFKTSKMKPLPIFHYGISSVNEPVMTSVLVSLQEFKPKTVVVSDTIMFIEGTEIHIVKKATPLDVLIARKKTTMIEKSLWKISDKIAFFGSELQPQHVQIQSPREILRRELRIWAKADSSNSSSVLFSISYEPDHKIHFIKQGEFDIGDLFYIEILDKENEK